MKGPSIHDGKMRDSREMEFLNVKYESLDHFSQGSYSKLRLENKISFTVALMILLRATTSIGVLTNQFYFIKNGYINGTFLIIILIALIIFTMNLFLQIVNDIESDNMTFIESYEGLMLKITQNPRLNFGFYIIAKVKFFISRFSV